MSLEIVSLGFDLDNTLYKPNPEINEKIQEYACRRASGVLGLPYEELRPMFDEHYSKTQSMSKSLFEIGLEDNRDLIQKALENADVVSVLERDEKLISMFERLSERYKLFLITSSSEKIALEKLSKLGINFSLLFPALYEVHRGRTDGSAFRYVSQQHDVPFERMMFVGDREKTDVIPAKQLGIKTAIVNSVSDQADYQLKDIYDLERVLNP